MTNPGKELARRQRLQLVEEYMLDGRGPKEIHEIISDKYKVTYGTIRNDVVAIRKAHKTDIDEATELKGREEFLARARLLRRKAMIGFQEATAQGITVTRDRDLRLVGEQDKIIAALHGVDLKLNDRQIHLNITAARNEMEKVMIAVFSVVTDPDTQDLIIKAIEASAEENLQIEAP